jgi:hypothetical protein
MENNSKIGRKTMPEIIAQYKAIGQKQNSFQIQKESWNNLLETVTLEELTILFVKTSIENNDTLDPEEILLYGDNSQDYKDLENIYKNALKNFKLQFFAQNLHRFKTDWVAQGLAGSVEENFKSNLKSKIEHLSVTRE